MITELPGSTAFSTPLSQYSVVGFHATSSSASSAIERIGFLPHKILDEATHSRLIELARHIKIDTRRDGGYEQWLQMKSITFTKTFVDATNHVASGRFAGQGLPHISEILDSPDIPAEYHDLVHQVRVTIDGTRSSNPVIYAVDLSDLGERLVEPKYASYYQVFFDPTAPIPFPSIVGPNRLIARLNL